MREWSWLFILNVLANSVFTPRAIWLKFFLKVVSCFQLNLVRSLDRHQQFSVIVFIAYLSSCTCLDFVLLSVVIILLNSIIVLKLLLFVMLTYRTYLPAGVTI